MLPTIILISGPVEAAEVYRRAASALGLPLEFHKREGTRQKKGLTVIRPGEVEEEIPTGENRHDVAVWTSTLGSKLRWDHTTWPRFFVELDPLEPPTALVYMQTTWFEEDPARQAAAVEAVAQYCSERGAKYWWTSMLNGFGWEIAEPLWVNDLEKLNLLKVDA